MRKKMDCVQQSENGKSGNLRFLAGFGVERHVSDASTFPVFK